MTTPDRAPEPVDLDAIKARADAASSGPWLAASNTGRRDGIALVGRLKDRGTGQAVAVFAATDVRQRHRDAEFTAAARTDVPALVAEIERLRTLVGDEGAGGDEWRHCDRAEAIRQANEFHGATQWWLREHDARRDERDEARAELARARPVIEAAKAWVDAEWRRLHIATNDPEWRRAMDDRWSAQKAILAAVDTYRTGGGE